MPWNNPFVAISFALIALTCNADQGWHKPTSAQRIPLTDRTLAATREQRQLLKYLVSCALPAGVEVYAHVNEAHYTFQGSLGLAPAWAQRALSETEQRWVSACILARTNHFGKSVRISMRARRQDYPALQASQQEKADYTLFEGGFFGNIFAEQPVGYVCSDDRGPAKQADPVLVDRVCTALSGERTATGAPLTRCGFVHIGPCDEATHFTVDGKTYHEVIFTYLMESVGSDRPRPRD